MTWQNPFQYEFANPQMAAQQSLFTICGQLGEDHDVALERSLPERSDTLKVVIQKELKQKLRQRLFLMNVAALNLFPNVDGVGRHIREATECGFPLGVEGLLSNYEDRLKLRRKDR